MGRPAARVLNSQLAPLMLGIARRRGVAVEPLIRRFSLPEDVDRLPETRLPLATFRDFSDALAEAVGDPFFGVTVATSLPKGAYGLMEFIAQSSATVGEAISALNRYSAILNEIVEFSLVRQGDEALFRHRIPGEPEVTGRHANEFMLVYTAEQIRDRSGRPFAPKKVWFAHAREGDLGPLPERLGTDRIEFGKGENGLLFDASVLDHPMVGAEPALHSFLTSQAEARLSKLPAPASLRAEVRAQVEQRLSSGNVSIEAIARAFHMSGRTLQRRLEDEQLSYQELVDDVRRTRALLYLEDPRMGLSEVAFRLGYGDVRSFTRAYKRWTGAPPRGQRA